MIRLTEAALGDLRSLLPPGRDLAAWHAALVDEIARHLSPAHAQLLARPERTDGGTAWIAEGAARSRYAELGLEGRRALDAALGVILSDIRRLAESGVALAVREAWPALREIPDMGHVFAVDGRPVLAAWGHAGAGTGISGRLARLDDGVPWRVAPRTPWGRYGAALGVLAALALAAGLLLPLASRWLVDPPAACAIVPGQLDAMRGQMALDSRGQELRTLLATLTEETGRRQLQCPIPAAPRPPALGSPVPPRAGPPRAAWEPQDLSTVQGCWHLSSTMYTSNGQGRITTTQAWQMCFDGAGHGNQEVKLQDGRGCSGPLEADFDGGFLRVTHTRACAGPGLSLKLAVLRCSRESDAEARCKIRNADADGESPDFVTFNR